MRERVNQRSGQECCLVRTNSHCKREVVVHVQQKSPGLYLYFNPCPIAFWTSLQLENMSTIEINTDWKSLQIPTFSWTSEKTIKLVKK